MRIQKKIGGGGSGDRVGGVRVDVNEELKFLRKKKKNGGGGWGEFGLGGGGVFGMGGGQGGSEQRIEFFVKIKKKKQFFFFFGGGGGGVGGGG